MESTQRIARRLPLLSGRSRDTVCSSCLARLSTQRRNAATASVVAAKSTEQSSSQMQHDPSSAPALHQAYQLRAGVVVSRPPLLTKPLHPFEKAFYLYQRRLNERLALPFTRYFYYKKGTPADVEWKRKAASRATASRDVGYYAPYGKEGWNDELLVGDKTSEPEAQVDALLRDAEGVVANKPAIAGAVEDQRKDSKKDVAVQRPQPRTTQADTTGDQTSLNRLLDQTLYLVVKTKEGRWRFPEDLVQGKEGLHDAAERVIVQSGGINMNTWVVGNAPIGHYQYNFPKLLKHDDKKVEELGEKVFFMKARLMAGQAKVSDGVLGYTDFKWLSKSEVASTVAPQYWSFVRNMLVDR